jgi:hypothetical protein
MELKMTSDKIREGEGTLDVIENFLLLKGMG